MNMAENTPSITKIRPHGWRVPLDLHEVWGYRELLIFLIWRDIKGRYKQTAFGPLWLLGAPLVNMVLLTIIFGRVAKLPSDGIPYPLFSYSALLPWGFFAASLSGTAGSLMVNRDLLAKVYFPRLIIPLHAILTALFNFAVSFLILLGMMVYYGYYPSSSMLLIPIYLILAASTGMAVGLWWASWIVHFHDLNNILQYVIKAWMYASPVVYASSLVPEQWLLLYRLNPMTNVIEGIRWSLLGVGRGPDIMLLWSSLLVLPVFVGGLYHFRRTERNIVDIA